MLRHFKFEILIWSMLFSISCQNETGDSFGTTFSQPSSIVAYSDLQVVDHFIKSFEYEKAKNLIDSLNQSEHLSNNVEFVFLKTSLNYSYIKSSPSLFNPKADYTLEAKNEKDSFSLELIKILQFEYSSIESLKNQLLSFEKKKTQDVKLLQRAYFILAEYYQSVKFNEHLSISYSQKLLELCERNLDFTNYYFAALENLINLELINRDVAKAQAYADKFALSSSSCFPQNKVLNAKALSLKGYVLCYLSKPDKALSYLYKALDMLPKKPCLYDKQEILKLILFICNNFGKWGEYKKYVTVLEHEIGDCEDYCNLNKIKGDNALMNGKHKDAIPYFLKAYSYITKNKPLDIPQLGSVIYYLHGAYLELGEFDNALNTYYTETVDPIPNEIIDWQRDKIFDKSKKETTFYFMTLGCYSRVFYEKYRSYKNENDLIIAREFLDSSRVFIQKETNTSDEDRLLSIFKYTEEIYDLGVLINTALYNLHGHDKYLNEVYQYSEESKAKILYSLLQNKSENKWEGIKIQRSIDSLALSGGGPMEMIKLKNSIDSLGIPHQSIKAPNLLSKVQSQLDSNEVLIDYNIINDQIFIHYIFNDSSSLFINTYGEKERERIKEIIDSYKDLNFDSEVLKANAKDGFSILFPYSILPYQITINPDQELLNLNFEMLIDESSHDLIENHLIVYYGAGRQLLSTSEYTNEATKNLVAFFFSDEHSITNAPLHLDELPGNISERRLIEKTFPSAQIYSGNHNTKSQFLTTISDQPRDIIYIASHGYSSDKDAKDIRLYFRDEQYSLDSIYAYDILDKKLNTDLVILSACHSGAGLNFRGEGKFDWARYFILSGARAVISSLWEVDDSASKLLFNYFYNSKKSSYKEKIREAKIKLKANPKYNHPYYWGGFIYSS